MKVVHLEQLLSLSDDCLTGPLRVSLRKKHLHSRLRGGFHIIISLGTLLSSYSATATRHKFVIT